MKDGKDAYHEGFLAYERDLEEEDNPYNKYPEKNQWNSGWHQSRINTAIKRRFIF